MLYTKSDDWYIGSEVKLPHSGEMMYGKILSRKRTSDGKMLLGKANPNPILDTCVYNVQFLDGSIEEYTTNIISESIVDQSDDEGYYYNIMRVIVGYRRGSDAISIDKGTVKENGTKKKIVTTKGWDLHIEWDNGLNSWLPLRIVKNSYPVETAEYSISRGLQDEPYSEM